MRVPISSLTDKSVINSTYLVKLKAIQLAKNGKPYLNLTLMDSTGEIGGRVWEDAEELSKKFDRGDVVQVLGHANLYQGKLQLVIQDLNIVPKDQINRQDFLPVSPRNIDEMFSELKLNIKIIKNPYLKKLAENIFSNSALSEKFKQAPAATGVHHVFLGGLLQHVLSLCSLVKAIAPLYKDLNQDLLLSACFFHDIGKTTELSYDTNFEYTDEGKLLGHIVQGTLLIEKEISKIDGFPQDLRNSLIHIILSHHGEYEFGSPKRPKFLEAIVFHFLDNLDSKIEGVQSFIEKNQTDKNWSPHHRIYDRYFYSGPLGTEIAKSIKTPQKEESAFASLAETLSPEAREKLKGLVQEQSTLF